MEHTFAKSDVCDEAIERLMSEYGTAILRVCYTYVKDMSLAEDAMQDTFIKAYKSYGRFRSEHDNSEKAWLMRIAINTCKDYLRTSWFRHVDRNLTPEEMIGFGEESKDRTLILTIMALPAKLKDVLVLYYYQGLTIQEIGDALGLSKSAVHHRLKEAQKQLKEELEVSIDG